MKPSSQNGKNMANWQIFEGCCVQKKTLFFGNREWLSQISNEYINEYKQFLFEILFRTLSTYFERYQGEVFLELVNAIAFSGRTIVSSSAD